MVMPGTSCWGPGLGSEFEVWWPYTTLQYSSEQSLVMSALLRLIFWQWEIELFQAEEATDFLFLTYWKGGLTQSIKEASSLLPSLEVFLLPHSLTQKGVNISTSWTHDFEVQKASSVPSNCRLRRYIMNYIFSHDLFPFQQQLKLYDGQNKEASYRADCCEASTCSH